MQLFGFGFRKPGDNLPVRTAYSKIAWNRVLTVWSTANAVGNSLALCKILFVPFGSCVLSRL